MTANWFHCPRIFPKFYLTFECRAQRDNAAVLILSVYLRHHSARVELRSNNLPRRHQCTPGPSHNQEIYSLEHGTVPEHLLVTYFADCGNWMKSNHQFLTGPDSTSQHFFLIMASAKCERALQKSIWTLSRVVTWVVSRVTEDAAGWCNVSVSAQFTKVFELWRNAASYEERCIWW